MSELNCLIYNSCNRSEDPSSISFSFFFDDGIIFVIILISSREGSWQAFYS